jgi:hypothetical protein
MATLDIEQIARVRLDQRVKDFADGLALIYYHAEAKS